MTQYSLKSLSTKLFRAVILSALLVGSLFSITQIILDASSARKELDNKALQFLTVMVDPATTAARESDSAMAQQVVESLYEYKSIYYASISSLNKPILAKKAIPHIDYHVNWLAKLIFGDKLTFTIELINGLDTAGITPDKVGELTIALDPSHESQLFLQRATYIFMAGVLRALAFSLVLYFIYHILLTKPLLKVIDALRNIDPQKPAKYIIPTPAGHESDEIGYWVDTVNELLKSIEANAKQRQHAEAQAEHLSNYDILTQLPNRKLLETRLKQALRDTDKHGKIRALFCCSLDDFKSVNQTHSYDKGDKLLSLLAERLTKELHFAHTISRLGGDEFSIITEELSQHYDVASLAQQVLRTICSPYLIGSDVIEIKATIGISVFPLDGEYPETILKNAENVMHLAKAEGGHRYQFYVASVDSNIRELRALETELSRALEQNKLFLVYQAQIDLNNRKIKGAEALIRWQHPTRGLIPPSEFIPLAERNNQIIPIGTWVLDTACAEISRWQALGYDDLCISVNISAVQLKQDNFVDIVKSILQKHKVNPSHLELEITETAIMNDINRSIETLETLKAMGLRLAIDDFGTGYSSLSHLKRLPLDKVKIDREFIHDVLDDPNDATIVKAIIQLSNSLNLEVIAEGVETLEQEQYLRQYGCTEGQGYYYSKPVTSDDFIALLEKQKEADLAVS